MYLFVFIMWLVYSLKRNYGYLIILVFNENIFFSNSTWSIYNFRRNFIKEFIRKGHEVYIVSNKDYTTKFLKKIGCNFINLKFNTLNKNIFYELINLIKFIRIVKKINQI